MLSRHTMATCHTVRGTPAARQFPSLPHILLLLLWAEEDLLVEGRVSCSSPHPGTPQSPGTPVSLPPCILAPPRPCGPVSHSLTRYYRVLHLCVPVPRVLFRDRVLWVSLVPHKGLDLLVSHPSLGQVVTRKCHLEAWAKQGRVWGHSACCTLRLVSCTPTPGMPGRGSRRRFGVASGAAGPSSGQSHRELQGG